MEIRSIIAIIALFAATAVVADAYKWVDEDGVVQYSDRPHPGAERFRLPTDDQSISGYSPVRSASLSSSQNDEPPADDGPVRYESLTISAPGAEQTLWNIAGVLNVSLAVTPGLQSDHQLRVYLDGGSPQVVNSTNFQLEEVYRGVHNIQAEIVDVSGAVMIRSQPNRFYVQQTTVKR